MKTLLAALILLSSLAHAGLDGFEWYPEDRPYTSAESKMGPYIAKSLYNTSTFTLTFDDGPDISLTPKLLDVLKKHETKATFFVLTKNLSEATFPIIKRMLDEGHIVASHGIDHQHAPLQTREQYSSDLKVSLLKLAEFHIRAGYEFQNIYYRFPYGDFGKRADYHHLPVMLEISRSLMGDNCIQFAFWDVDTADWVPKMTSQEVAQNIIINNEGGKGTDFEAVKNSQGKITGYRKKTIIVKNPIKGGVVLQHDVHAITPGATDLFLTYARENAVSVVRLDEVEEFKVLRHCSLQVE